MNVVILQPSYIPWRGYFHQIRKADLFIFYDDVQYDRRGWRNRNRIKTPAGAQWLSIPVLSKAAQIEKTPINRIEIDETNLNWREKHFKTLRQNYRKAPFFERYEKLLIDFYQRADRFLADFTIATTIRLARELGITRTKFRRSSEFKVEGAKTDRLLDILQIVGATRYISGARARNYIEPEKFSAANIELEFMSYDYPDYEQLYPPFDQHVSILDLLLMTGDSAPEFIWANKENA